MVPLKICAMPTASEGAPPVRSSKRALADALRESCHRLRIEREAPRTDGLRGGVGGFADDSRRTIDREIDAGLQRARRHHRHHADKRFHQHRAVADGARVAFAQNHLRRGAGRNQRVETADRAACNRDEAERKYFAGEYGAVAIDESRERRHFESWGAPGLRRPPARAIAPTLMNALR